MGTTMVKTVFPLLYHYFRLRESTVRTSANILEGVLDMTTPLHVGGLGAVDARWLEAQLREQILPCRTGRGKLKRGIDRVAQGVGLRQSTITEIVLDCPGRAKRRLLDASVLFRCKVAR